MRYLSVCSGIEAASVAWAPIGWQAAAFCEIDAFPSTVLANHYPAVPNHDDLEDLAYSEDLYDIDFSLLVGGTPCQSFSISGLQKGLRDPRGALIFSFLQIVKRKQPQWLVWENVPNVLRINGGRDFATFLSGLSLLGYGFAFRVLNALDFGVPQNRERVFVIGYCGNWRPAAACLFDPEELWRDAKPDNKTRREGGQDDGAQRAKNPSCTKLFRRLAHGYYKEADYASCLRARDYKGDTDILYDGTGLRYLSPLEYERLMGFPDDYTNVPYKGKENAPDTLRKKALGNSMAVPVMHWIGNQIQGVMQAL